MAPFFSIDSLQVRRWRCCRWNRSSHWIFQVSGPQGISRGLLHIPPETVGNLYIAMTSSDVVFLQLGARFQMVLKFLCFFVILLDTFSVWQFEIDSAGFVGHGPQVCYTSLVWYIISALPPTDRVFTRCFSSWWRADCLWCTAVPVARADLRCIAKMWHVIWPLLLEVVDGLRTCRGFLRKTYKEHIEKAETRMFSWIERGAIIPVCHGGSECKPGTSSK